MTKYYLLLSQLYIKIKLEGQASFKIRNCIHEKKQAKRAYKKGSNVLFVPTRRFINHI